MGDQVVPDLPSLGYLAGARALGGDGQGVAERRT